MPCKMFKGQQRVVSAPCGNWTKVALLSVTHLNHQAIGLYWQSIKQYITCCIFSATPACRIVVLGLFKLNIKARHEITVFLNINIWSIHFIAFDLDWTHWSWNIFTLLNFCSMLIKQLIDFKKWELITWYLGQIFEIKDGWSVTQ